MIINNIDDLIQKAKTVVPKKPKKWVQLKPVWAELKKSGMQATEAAKWMAHNASPPIPENEIPRLVNQIARWIELDKQKHLPSNR